MDYGVDSST